MYIHGLLLTSSCRSQMLSRGVIHVSIRTPLHPFAHLLRSLSLVQASTTGLTSLSTWCRGFFFCLRQLQRRGYNCPPPSPAGPRAMQFLCLSNASCWLFCMVAQSCVDLIQSVPSPPVLTAI